MKKMNITAQLRFREYIPENVIAIKFCDMEFFGEGREELKQELDKYLNGKELDSFSARSFLQEKGFNINSSIKETETIHQEIFSKI